MAKPASKNRRTPTIDTESLSAPPLWFQERLMIYMPDLANPGMSPDRHRYGGSLSNRESRKYRAYQIEQAGIAWNAVRSLNLEAEIQVPTMLARCWDYAFARSCDLQNQSTRLGASEKEQRRRARQLALTIRKLASQIRTVRYGESSGGATEILSRILWRAFWSEEGSLVPRLGPDLLELADSIDRCLEGGPGTKELDTQAKAWGRMRENALLGPEMGGDGMVSLALKPNRKIDYPALVKIVLVLNPGLGSLKESELANETERRREERRQRTKSGK